MPAPPKQIRPNIQVLKIGMSWKSLSQIPGLSKGLHATRNLPEELEMRPVELISASFFFINTSKLDLFEASSHALPKDFPNSTDLFFHRDIPSSASKFSLPTLDGENRQEKDRERNSYLIWLTSHSYGYLMLPYSFNKINLQYINIICMFQIK